MHMQANVPGVKTWTISKIANRNILEVVVLDLACLIRIACSITLARINWL